MQYALNSFKVKSVHIVSSKNKIMETSNDENNNKIIDLISSTNKNIDEFLNELNETKKIEEFLNAEISSIETKSEPSLNTKNLSPEDENHSTATNLETYFPSNETIDLDITQTIEEFKKTKLKYKEKINPNSPKKQSKYSKIYRPIIKRAIKAKDSIKNSTSILSRLNIPSLLNFPIKKLKRSSDANKPAPEIEKTLNSNDENTIRRSKRFRVQARANLKPIYTNEYLIDNKGNKVRLKKCIGYEEISNDLIRFTKKVMQTRLSF